MNAVGNDPGGHHRAMAAHSRAAQTHSRAAELHEDSANLHEEHAAEMMEKGLHKSARRAEQIADRQRVLVDLEERRADKHRRIVAGQSPFESGSDVPERDRRAVLARLRDRLRELDRLRAQASG